MKTRDEGQRNCPKHVEFHFQNKFEKLVHLVGFIIRKLVTMHGHMSVKRLENIWTRCNFKYLTWFRMSEYCTTINTASASCSESGYCKTAYIILQTLTI
jgi:hypothetical protein